MGNAALTIDLIGFTGFRGILPKYLNISPANQQKLDVAKAAKEWHDKQIQQIENEREAIAKEILINIKNPHGEVILEANGELHFREFYNDEFIVRCIKEAGRSLSANEVAAKAKYYGRNPSSIKCLFYTMNRSGRLNQKKGTGVSIRAYKKN